MNNSSSGAVNGGTTSPGDEHDSIDARLEASFSRWNLLESKFYQAWSAGTLPLEALREYSKEYGAFISLIGDGWAAHGDREIAHEEREHAELWRAFAKGLGTDIGAPETPEVALLVSRAKEYFADPVQSVGALYAFELQQPRTARSKLDGLKAHYPQVSTSTYTYFDVHCHDEHEPALLRERLGSMPEQDRERALVACEETCRLLREALDGLYDANVSCAVCQVMTN